MRSIESCCPPAVTQFMHTVYVCVWECVGGRESERERDHACVILFIWIHGGLCVYKWTSVNIDGGTIEGATHTHTF